MKKRKYWEKRVGEEEIKNRSAENKVGKRRRRRRSNILRSKNIVRKQNKVGGK